MRGVNALFLLGTLRGEPEQLTAAKSGKTYAKFEIDVVTVRRKDGMDEEQREILPVTAFGKLGDIVVKYFKPGDPLHITGHISAYEYKTDAGATKRTVSIIADAIQLIPASGRKQDTSGQSRWCGEPSEQPPPKLKQAPLNELGELTQLPF